MAAKRIGLIPLFGATPLARLSKVTIEMVPDNKLPGCIVRATSRFTDPPASREGADRRVTVAELLTITT